MEIRVLHYFLTVAREQSITGAAQVLNLSQPTLSTQLKALEEEIGKPLLIRGSKGTRKVTLTEEGMLLRRRAEEIISLVNITEKELRTSNEIIAGDIYIGAGETDGMRFLANIFSKIQKDFPDIHFHVSSGDLKDVMDDMEKGLVDFGLLFHDVDEKKYNSLPLPLFDTWGVLMRKDDKLSSKSEIYPRDLYDLPLIFSRQSINTNQLANWFKKDPHKLNIVATYNLLFNASLMVEEGLGYAITFDKIINTTGDSNLVFIPLAPKLTANMSISWKKYQKLSKASEKFLEILRRELK
ncbi:LysR family transcriptional regulator [Terrisporobacter sp.]